jgi:molecular chaperone GrpE
MANPKDDNDTRNRSTTAEAVDDSADVAGEVHGEAQEAPAATADPIEELTREKEALQNRLLRLAAEFDNYRKRVDRERRDQADAAVANAVEDLLPIIDNLERALEAPAGADSDSYRQGVELIYRQMLDLLRRRGVTPIESVGTDFDPQIHQAVVHEASSDHREGEVMEELRRGYRLGDRLLRPSMVKVAKA